MVAGVAATYAVVTVDVDVFLEVLVSLDESLGVLEGVLRWSGCCSSNLLALLRLCLYRALHAHSEGEQVGI